MKARINQLAVASMAALALIGFVGAGATIGSSQDAAVPAADSAAKRLPAGFIVQAHDASRAASLVQSAGGEITRELAVINGVAARLTPAQLTQLRARADVSVTPDRSLKTAGFVPESYYPAQVGAEALRAEGLTGRGITVAILDTGMWYSDNYIKRDLDENNRLIAQYDTFEGKMRNAKDQSGHGTHIASVLAGVRLSSSGKPLGVAPNVNLVNVKAFDRDGSGSYANVIDGINWVIQNKDEYGIRILNMSFGAPAQSYYWEDPLNQAVMAAWQAGIVVVTSAGNLGPDPMTVGVPGNVPYVITVGAATDSYTPFDPSDDRLASFSAAGPTHAGFVKPELVAPGGHMAGTMDNGNHDIADAHPEFMSEDARVFTMSGTSQSAAVVSGVAALLLEAEPNLTPDQLKCKLMSTARPIMNTDGAMAFSVFQQGAGMVDGYAAVHEGAYNCANQGMDIDLDLAGIAHYGGPANLDEDGNFYIADVDGYLWRGPGVDGYLWGGRFVGSNGYLWGGRIVGNDGYLWSGRSFIDGYLWRNPGIDGYLWSGGPLGSASINVWVEQE